MVGVHRRGLEHERGRPVNEGPVDDVRVPCDPPHVGHAGEDVPLFQSEGVLGGHPRVQEVAGGGVGHPLGATGGAGGVQDEEEVL